MEQKLQDYTDETLKAKASDRLASFIKGLTDFAGIPGTNISLSNTIGELVFPFIKDQWQDRANHIMSLLAREIDRIPREKLDRIAKLEWCANLFEEGILTALKTYSQERREHIAYLLVNSLSEEKLIIEESIAILRILASLNDSQIVLLKYHANLSDIEFYYSHKEIISGEIPISAKPNEKKSIDLVTHIKYINELVQNDLLNRTTARKQTANSGYDHIITKLGIKLLELISSPSEERS